jgi:hypothetical protein
MKMKGTPKIGIKYKVITESNEPTGTKRGDTIKITKIHGTSMPHGILLEGFNEITNKILASGIWSTQIEEFKMSLMDLELK